MAGLGELLSELCLAGGCVAVGSAYVPPKLPRNSVRLTYRHPFPIRSLHCLNPAIITFVLSAVSVPTLTFTPQTVATFIVHFKLDYCNSVLWSSEISNKSSPTHPECSCSAPYNTRTLYKHTRCVRISVYIPGT